MNYSCAYNAIIVLLWNVYVDSDTEFWEWVSNASGSVKFLFEQFAAKLTSSPLELIRDKVRDLLSLSDPVKFP